MSWNGTNETERTFFNSSGEQLGDSRTNIDTWNNGTTDVTNTNTNYHDANGEWLGNEYSNDQGEAGYMFTSTVEKYETDGSTLTSGWTALATDFPWLLASGETAINFTYDDGQGGTVEITTIKVESGSNTYTIGEGSAATTVTETREHLMSENWDHLGGKEVRDGETIQWSANWERGAATFDVSGSTGIDQTSKAYELFGDGGTSEVFSREEKLEGPNGTEYETTYYDTSGEKLGSSQQITFQMYDGATETNINYNGPNGEPIGFERSDTNGNSGYSFESTVAKYGRMVVFSFLAGQHLLQTFHGFLRQGKRR